MAARREVQTVTVQGLKSGQGAGAGVERIAGRTERFHR